jgi:hypothetical protein
VNVCRLAKVNADLKGEGTDENGTVAVLCLIYDPVSVYTAQSRIVGRGTIWGFYLAKGSLNQDSVCVPEKT